MSKILIIAAIILAGALILRLLILFQDRIKFFATGSDAGFKFREISALWKLAKNSDLEDPCALYVSTPTLNSCIAKLITDAKKNGTDNSFGFQSFLEKLYQLRTRQLLDTDKKRGLESSKYLDVGQKISVILKGKGVFNSQIINNGRELVISLPKQFNKKANRFIILPEEDWENKDISVYLWRKKDACYAFDTHVFSTGMFRSQKALFLKHSYDLARMQKRQSIRCACEIYAQMYIIKNLDIDYNEVETQPGYKCLLEDISQDGAMIRIGGKGENNVQIKIQFDLNGSLIIMFGVVRAVEYNQTLNQSRLHFECTHINPAMQNSILTFIYNIIPQEEKEIHDAIKEVEQESTDEDSGLEDLGSEIPESPLAESNLQEPSGDTGINTISLEGLENV